MTSGFHMLREIKLILKISRISHMSGFYLLGGRGEVPPNLSAPPKKVFPEKKLKAISNTDLIKSSQVNLFFCAKYNMKYLQTMMLLTIITGNMPW